MRFLLLVIIIFSSVFAQAKIISAKDTYILAIGVCPPWKKGMESYCKNAVTQIVEVLQQRINIPKDNIHIVLNAQATYAGVEKGFAWLADKANKNSRAIIYMNSHGGKEPDGSGDKFWSNFRDRYKDHEVFVLWTKDQPFSVDYAIASKQWMMAAHIREMLDNISAQKIMVIDACKAGITEDDFLRAKVAKAQEAFIFSSPPLSLAFTNDVYKMPLFTFNLARAIAKEDNLAEAFAKAREETIFKALRKAVTNSDCLIRGGGEVCAQLPIKEDPDDILKQVIFSDKN